VNESDPEIQLLEKSVETGEALFAPSRAASSTIAVGSVSGSKDATGLEAAGAPVVHVTWTNGEPFPAPVSNVDRAALATEGIFFQWSDTVAEPEDAAPSEAPRGAATMTLGRLYVEQGHRSEAESVFRSLLDADPDHEEARQALADLGMEETLSETVEISPPLALAVPEPVHEPSEVEASAPAIDSEARARTRRKIEVLRGYLGRITRGREERV
jgi:hypothetical protein